MVDGLTLHLSQIHASDCLETNELQQEQVVPSSSRQSKRKVIKPTQTAEEEEDMDIEEVMEMRAESLPTVVGRERFVPFYAFCCCVDGLFITLYSAWDGVLGLCWESAYVGKVISLGKSLDKILSKLSP